MVSSTARQPSRARLTLASAGRGTSVRRATCSKVRAEKTLRPSWSTATRSPSAESAIASGDHAFGKWWISRPVTASHRAGA